MDLKRKSNSASLPVKKSKPNFEDNQPIFNWVDRIDDFGLDPEVLAQFKEMCKSDDENGTSDNESIDPTWNPIVVYHSSGKQIHINLLPYAIECDRFRIPDTAAAFLVNALLTSLGFITNLDRTFVIDRMRMVRARNCVRQLVRTRDLQTATPLVILSFDGKVDWTKVMVRINGKTIPMTVRQNHYVLTQLIGTDVVYLGHITIPGKKTFEENGTNGSKLNLDEMNFQEDAEGNLILDESAKSGPRKSKDNDKEKEAYVAVERMLLNFESSNIKLDHLRVINCDGCRTNCGKWRGIIRRLEERLGRSLQRSICLFHCNELPLRHLFLAIDKSKTSGPNCFSGKIGKLLQTVEKRPINSRFKRIHVDYFPNISEEVLKTLSRDQKMLFQICRYISGETDEYYDAQPGPLYHARWLTLVIRILRLFISFENAPMEVQILTEFVMRVYAPTWFDIKQKPLGINGPIHFCNMISRSQFLPAEYRSVVEKVLIDNSNFAHHENVLIAMLADSRVEIKQKAVDKILEIRAYERQQEQDKLNEIKLVESDDSVLEANEVSKRNSRTGGSCVSGSRGGRSRGRGSRGGGSRGRVSQSVGLRGRGSRGARSRGRGGGFENSDIAQRDNSIRSNEKTVRRYETPRDVNLLAKNYVDLVDWDKKTLAQLNEPPLTVGVPDDKLATFLVPE